MPRRGVLTLEENAWLRGLKICADQYPQRRAWNTYSGLQAQNTFVGNMAEHENAGTIEKEKYIEEISGPFQP
jgi:hypothetical protein